MVKFLLTRRTIFCAITAVLLLSIFVSLWNFNAYTEQQLERESRCYMADIRRQAAFNLKNNLDFWIHKLESEAHLFHLTDTWTVPSIIAELARFAEDKDICRASIRTADGLEYTSDNQVPTVDPAPFRTVFPRRDRYIKQSQLSVPANQPLIALSTPVCINGLEYGSLSISYHRDDLQQVFNIPFPDGNCAILLIDRYGTVIHRISQRAAPAAWTENIFDFYGRAGIQFPEGSLDQLRQTFLTQTTVDLKYKTDGVTYFASFSPIERNDWYVATTITEEAAHLQSRGFKRRATLLAIEISASMALAGLLFIAYDMQERRILKQLKNAYRLALKKSNDLFLEIDLENDTYVNHSDPSREPLGEIRETRFSRLIQRYAEYCVPEDRAAFLEGFRPENLRRVSKDQEIPTSFEYCLLSKQRGACWLQCTIIPVLENGQSVQKIICIEKNITQQKRKAEILRNAAQLDGLTTLYNKVTAAQLIDEFLTNEGKDGTHALFMMDIDRFKKINDRFGHMMGDEVLMQFGKTLHCIFRKNDILGRSGGDEFIALLKDCSTRENAALKAEQINDCFRKTVLKKNSESDFVFSVSIGIALFHADGDTFASLYQNADMALYAAKNADKGRYAFFDGTEGTF